MSQWLAGQAGRYDAGPPPPAADETRTPPPSAPSPDAHRSSLRPNGNERLYEAYNDLHALAQDFQKPFDAPAILVVGHQTDGKSGEWKGERSEESNARVCGFLGGGAPTLLLAVALADCGQRSVAQRSLGTHGRRGRRGGRGRERPRDTCPNSTSHSRARARACGPSVARPALHRLAPPPTRTSSRGGSV